MINFVLVFYDNFECVHIGEGVYLGHTIIVALPVFKTS